MQDASNPKFECSYQLMNLKYNKKQYIKNKASASDAGVDTF